MRSEVTSDVEVTCYVDKHMSLGLPASLMAWHVVAIFWSVLILLNCDLPTHSTDPGLSLASLRNLFCLLRLRSVTCLVTPQCPQSSHARGMRLEFAPSLGDGRCGSTCWPGTGRQGKEKVEVATQFSIWRDMSSSTS